MSGRVHELKAQIYDEILKKTVAKRNIAILEQQLQAEYQKESKAPLALAETSAESETANNA